MRPQTQANIFVCLLDHAYEVSLANSKMECQRWLEKPLMLERSGTQYVAKETKLLNLYDGAHFEESYCKESNISDTNWLRYLSSSYPIKIWWRWCHHLANLHILTIRIFFGAFFFSCRLLVYVWKWVMQEKCDFRHSRCTTKFNTILQSLNLCHSPWLLHTWHV